MKNKMREKMKKLHLLFFVFYFFMFKLSFAQWLQTGFPTGNGGVYSFTVSGTTLFAGCQNGVFLTNNYGTNWSPAGLQGDEVISFVFSGSTLFAGTAGHGIYSTTNNGISWIQVNNGLTNFVIRTLAISGTNIFAGTESGIFRSSNNGTSWIAVNSGLTNTYITSIAVSGSNIFAGTQGGVFYSTNNGASWTAVNNGLTNTLITALTFSGGSLFAGTQNGVFRTTNNGTNWTFIGLTGATFSALLDIPGTGLLAANNLGNVFLSTNNGSNWSNVSTGLPNMGILCLAFIPGADPIVFAGNDNSQVYRRLLTQMLSVKVISSIVPLQFNLSQNYPNPFNPNTKIQFALPKNVFLKLIIYDVLGREVETIVNENLKAGTYEINWDATNYPCGVYYYRLQTRDFVETKKMILLK